MWIKQLCNRQFWDFALALRAPKRFRRFQETGPRSHLCSVQFHWSVIYMLKTECSLTRAYKQMKISKWPGSLMGVFVHESFSLQGSSFSSHGVSQKVVVTRFSHKESSIVYLQLQSNESFQPNIIIGVFESHILKTCPIWSAKFSLIRNNEQSSPFTALEWLTDITSSNARRFYSSKGNFSGTKGLTLTIYSRLAKAYKNKT